MRPRRGCRVVLADGHGRPSNAAGMSGTRRPRRASTCTNVDLADGAITITYGASQRRRSAARRSCSPRTRRPDASVAWQCGGDIDSGQCCRSARHCHGATPAGCGTGTVQSEVPAEGLPSVIRTRSNVNDQKPLARGASSFARCTDRTVTQSPEDSGVIPQNPGDLTIARGVTLAVTIRPLTDLEPP